MQFKVPQFLDIEDKIFGPFTFREFVYLAGGGGLCFVLYKLLGFLLGIIPMLAVAGFSLALTFYRPNGKPFINMLEAGFKYAISYKLYIWKKAKKKISAKEQEERAAEQKTEAMNRGEAGGAYGGVKLGASKLRDLAWSLDVLDLKKEEK